MEEKWSKEEGKKHWYRLPDSSAVGPDGLGKKRKKTFLVLKNAMTDPLKSLTV